MRKVPQNWRYGNYRNGLQTAPFEPSIFRAMACDDPRKTAMCLALYLAASRALPVIAWDDANPAFHVVHLPKSADGVRKHFHYDYVYYAGSEQGCSCAFNYEHEYNSILELKTYLRNALTYVNEVEVFACHVGAEEHETQHAQIISPEGIALPEFYFKDGQYLAIRSGRYSQRVTEAERCLQQRGAISSDCSKEQLP